MRKNYVQYGFVVLSLFFSMNLVSAEISRIGKQVHSMYENFSKQIKDMTIVKETRIVAGEGKMSTETKIMQKGEKFRVENTMNMPQSSGMFGNMKTIIICDGKDTWMISPMMGKRKITGEEGEKYKRTEDWWKYISNNAKITGTEKVGTKNCYIIKKEDDKSTGFTKMWIDKKSLTLVKFEGSDNKGESMVGINSDFRKIKGNIEMPYKTETYINGKLFTVSEITSLTINKGLSDELFDADRVKTQGMNMQEMMKKAMEQGGK